MDGGGGVEPINRESTVQACAAIQIYSVSTLTDWVESLSERRSLFAFMQCSLLAVRYEHSVDSTMQSYNV